MLASLNVLATRRVLDVMRHHVFSALGEKALTFRMIENDSSGSVGNALVCLGCPLCCFLARLLPKNTTNERVRGQQPSGKEKGMAEHTYKLIE